MVQQVIGFAVMANLVWLALWLLGANPGEGSISTIPQLLYLFSKYIAIAFDSVLVGVMALLAVAHGFFRSLALIGKPIYKWHLKQATEYSVLFYAVLIVPLVGLYAVFGLWSAIAVSALYLLLMIFGSPDRTKKTKHGGENDPTSLAQAIKSSITFANLVGMEETKARLLKAGQQILSQHKQGVMNSSRNGILMFGPPGTGKTYFAEALAGELDIGFMAFNFSQANSKWIGEGTERVTQVFRDAISNAPVLLFLDEVDTVFISRGDIAQAEHESARLTSALLPLIEEARKAGVVLVAATNLIDRLDPASIREGRFDFKIEIGYPDVKARKSIVENAFKKNELEFDEAGLLKAVSRWEGYAIPRLQSVAAELKDAGIIKASFSDMMQAMRRIQGRKGQKKLTHTMDDVILSPKMRSDLGSLVWRLQHIDELEEMGGSLPTGILFYGDPGTGKSYTAAALANSADWAFLSVSGHDLVADEKRIDALMKEAADIRPVIVFIDEAEDVFGHRTGGFANLVTNKLLGIMDGASGRVPDIVFVAATNHPDSMDSAALRGGRFTEKFNFEAPSDDELMTFVDRWMSSKPKLVFDESITPQSLTTLLSGVSLANVKAILQSAANTAISQQKQVISFDLISIASQTVQPNR
jgi:transitional endoplasmic reticulum ATPase